MKTKEIMTRFIGLTLMSVLLLGVAPVSAAAQWNRRDDYRNDQYGRWDRDRVKQYSYLVGYNDGYGDGKRFGGRGGWFGSDYKNSDTYRHGMNGYQGWMQYTDTYRDNYRRGFGDGWKDGERGNAQRYDRDDMERVLGQRLERVYGDDHRYRRRGDRRDDDRGRGVGRGRDDDRNDRNEIVRIAQQNGYRDGFPHGRQDQARRRNYDYDHTSEYRNATRGYRSEYRNQDLYRQSYREGYRRGYDDGYRGRNSGIGGIRWPF